MASKKKTFDFCYHDYKNAIPVGKVDHICPKCLKMLDSGEWFLMTQFDVVDVTSEKTKKILMKRDKETSKKVKYKYKLENKGVKI